MMGVRESNKQENEKNTGEHYTPYHFSDQIKENGMGGAYSTNGRDDKYI